MQEYHLPLPNVLYMKTQKQLLEEHRKLLDDKFHRDYPNGQFVLQFNHYTALHLNLRRRTSHCSYKGIGVITRKPYDRIDTGIYDNPYQNSSFGKVYYYKTIDALVKGAQKKDVPQALINAFVEKCKSR